MSKTSKKLLTKTVYCEWKKANFLPLLTCMGVGQMSHRRHTPSIPTDDHSNPYVEGQGTGGRVIDEKAGDMSNQLISLPSHDFWMTDVNDSLALRSRIPNHSWNVGGLLHKKGQKFRLL